MEMIRQAGSADAVMEKLKEGGNTHVIVRWPTAKAYLEQELQVDVTDPKILPQAEFQVPIIWYVGKMRKKALFDLMIETKDTVYIWDIKSSADLTRFQWMLKDKYWVQEIHYTSGARAVFPGKKIVWQFLASSKQAPYLSQPFCMDDRSMEDAHLVYKVLCENYSEWVDAGRPPKGWLPQETVRVYF